MLMSREPDSVAEWLERLKAGDPAAAEKLWQRYCGQLVLLARQRTRGLPRRVADEEDVALSAFDSFCRGAAEGRFPQLHNRDNLWRLLVTITARKSRQVAMHLRRQKRGGNEVLDQAALAAAHGDEQHVLDQLLSREPTPELAAQAAEQYQRLLSSLPDHQLRRIAQWKMEGYSNEEIAAKLGCTPRTVERKLRIIRAFWEEEGQ
jgi:DNA-directed RNA polymerase specialized sigma24 family protein